MNAPVQVNPYLSGNFAPIATEDDFHDLKVRGDIPKGLRGAFYRNGPNPQFAPRDPNHHWFAGDGMLHAFFVEDGKVSYKNRYARTPKWETEHAAGKSLWGTFGNPMTSDPSVAGKDNGGVANTNVVWHAGKLLALEEGHQPLEMDPLTLATKGYVEYAGAAKRFTAHPKMDPETGEMVFFGYGIGAAPFSKGMAYGVVDRTGKVTRLDVFDTPYASMVHDFCVTDRHVLFPVLPLSGSLQRVMSGGPAFGWEPALGSHIGLMARNKGVETIRWLTTDPCYVFHPMNAWEEGDTLYADVMQYARAPLFPNADGSPGKACSAYLVRWQIDLSGKTDTVKQTRIDDTAGEFPRLDERRAGLSYRHGYFAVDSTDSGKVVFNGIAHIDFKTGKRVVHQFARGDVPGEPIFVPKSEGAVEGEGWLVALVYRGADDRSDFVVFDAMDVGKGPIGVAELPRRVPFGFHGNWRAA
ncbi:MAG: carotenoid oxygenase family protein [Alphaproteobacteria bacterium]|nr:carotenoid oxygenase family protein [Alphaproteobacteria bacterium]MBL7097707.1 carotenoid oxygenase family protein [Alphaproteobacteria bacterium]